MHIRSPQVKPRASVLTKFDDDHDDHDDRLGIYPLYQGISDD